MRTFYFIDQSRVTRFFCVLCFTVVTTSHFSASVVNHNLMEDINHVNVTERIVLINAQFIRINQQLCNLNKNPRTEKNHSFSRFTEQNSINVIGPTIVFTGRQLKHCNLLY